MENWPKGLDSKRDLKHIRAEHFEEYVDDVIDKNDASLSYHFLIFNIEKLNNSDAERAIHAMCSGTGNEDARYSYKLITFCNEILLYLDRSSREWLAEDILEKGDYVVVEALQDRLHLLALDALKPKTQARLEAIKSSARVT